MNYWLKQRKEYIVTFRRRSGEDREKCMNEWITTHSAEYYRNMYDDEYIIVDPSYSKGDY